MRSCSHSNPDGVIRENCTSTQKKKKKVGLKWNISPDMARAGERYLWCAVKANNTFTDQFSITAKKMSTLWQSVLLLPFDFFWFLTTQAVMAKRPKGQEHHLCCATPLTSMVCPWVILWGQDLCTVHLWGKVLSRIKLAEQWKIIYGSANFLCLHPECILHVGGAAMPQLWS